MADATLSLGLRSLRSGWSPMCGNSGFRKELAVRLLLLLPFPCAWIAANQGNIDMLMALAAGAQSYTVQRVSLVNAPVESEIAPPHHTSSRNHSVQHTSDFIFGNVAFNAQVITDNCR